MEKDPELVEELKKLNSLLAVLSRRLSPSRAFYQGILSALGSFFGTTVVLALIVYLLSRLNVGAMVSEWLSGVIAGSLPEFAAPSFDPNKFFSR